jgi:broad specificity phosphatase PhoE
MGKAAWEQVKAGKAAYDAGDAESAIRYWVSAPVSLLFAALSGKGALENTIHGAKIRAARARSQANLNEVSHEKYGAPWRDLTKEQKADVTYSLGDKVKAQDAAALGAEPPNQITERDIQQRAEKRATPLMGETILRGQEALRGEGELETETPASLAKKIEAERIRQRYADEADATIEGAPEKRPYEKGPKEIKGKPVSPEDELLINAPELTSDERAELREQLAIKEAKRQLRDERKRAAEESQKQLERQAFRVNDQRAVQPRAGELDFQRQFGEMEPPPQEVPTPAVESAPATEVAPKAPSTASEGLANLQRAHDMERTAETLRKAAEKAPTPVDAEELAREAQEAEKAAQAARIQREAVEREILLAKQAKANQSAGEPIKEIAGRTVDLVIPGAQGHGVHYAIVSAADLKPSHDPGTWQGRENAYQPRTSYGENKSVQQEVILRSQNIDPGLVLTDNPTPETGPPIIRNDGLVAGGNSRAMALQLAYKGGFGKAYYETLLQRAHLFGIESIPPIDTQPVLVRVFNDIHTDRAQMNRIGDELNFGSSRGYTEAERGAASAKKLSQKDAETIAGLLAEAEEDYSLRDLMRERNDYVANILLNSGIVEPTKAIEYVDADRKLTEKGKRLFELAVKGKVIDDPIVIDRVAKEIPSTDKKVDATLSLWMRLRARNDAWDIHDYLTDGLRLLLNVNDAAKELNNVKHDLSINGRPTPSSSVELYLYPEKYPFTKMELTFEEPIRNRHVHPITEAIAKLLEEKPANVKSALQKYVEAADKGDNKEQIGFGFGGSQEPWEAFEQYIGKQAGVEIDPEEWGRVLAKKKAKAQSVEAPSLAGPPPEPQVTVLPSEEKPGLATPYSGTERRLPENDEQRRRAEVFQVRISQLNSDLAKAETAEQKADIRKAISREKQLLAEVRGGPPSAPAAVDVQSQVDALTDQIEQLQSELSDAEAEEMPEEVKRIRNEIKDAEKNLKKAQKGEKVIETKAATYEPRKPATAEERALAEAHTKRDTETAMEMPDYERDRITQATDQQLRKWARELQVSPIPQDRAGLEKAVLDAKADEHIKQLAHYESSQRNVERIRTELGAGSEFQKKVAEVWPSADELEGIAQRHADKIYGEPLKDRAAVEKALTSARNELAGEIKHYESIRQRGADGFSDYTLKFAFGDARKELQHLHEGPGNHFGSFASEMDTYHGRILYAKGHINALLRELGQKPEFPEVRYSEEKIKRAGARPLGEYPEKIRTAVNNELRAQIQDAIKEVKERDQRVPTIELPWKQIAEWNSKSSTSSLGDYKKPRIREILYHDGKGYVVTGSVGNADSLELSLARVYPAEQWKGGEAKGERGYYGRRYQYKGKEYVLGEEVNAIEKLTGAPSKDDSINDVAAHILHYGYLWPHGVSEGLGVNRAKAVEILESLRDVPADRLIVNPSDFLRHAQSHSPRFNPEKGGGPPPEMGPTATRLMEEHAKGIEPRSAPPLEPEPSNSQRIKPTPEEASGYDYRGIHIWKSYNETARTYGWNAETADGRRILTTSPNREGAQITVDNWLKENKGAAAPKSEMAPPPAKEKKNDAIKRAKRIKQLHASLKDAPDEIEDIEGSIQDVQRFIEQSDANGMDPNWWDGLNRNFGDALGELNSPDEEVEALNNDPNAWEKYPEGWVGVARYDDWLKKNNKEDSPEARAAFEEQVPYYPKRMLPSEVAMLRDAQEQLRASIEEIKAGIPELEKELAELKGRGALPPDVAERHGLTPAGDLKGKETPAVGGPPEAPTSQNPPANEGEQIKLVQQEARRLLADGVTAFASGANRVADIRGFVKAGVPVGVDASRLTESQIQELESLAGKNVPVFVDSGAFSEMRRTNQGLVVDKPITDQEWRRRLDIYHRLAAKLGDKLTVVAPDMVGKQVETLERLRTYAKDLQDLKAKGVQIVVPIQFGEMEHSMPDEFWEHANDAAGFDVVKPGVTDFAGPEDYDSRKGMIPGFPMNKAAADPQSVTFFVEQMRPHAIHLLGMGADNANTGALIRALHSIDPKLQVTMDSNLLRAHTGEGRRITEAERGGVTREDAVAGTFEGRKVGGQIEGPPEPPKTGAEQQGSQPLSVKSLRTQLEKAFPKVSKDQREAAMLLMKMRADKLGMSLDDFVAKHIAGVEAGGTAGEGALQQGELQNPTVFLVRHGETNLNDRLDNDGKDEGDTSAERIRGWADVPLNDNGRQKAIETGQKLAKYPITRIISSDLGRAKETSEIIRKQFGRDVPVEYTEELRPMHWGEYTGQPVKEAIPAMEYYTEHPDEEVPGGETFNNFLGRWHDVLERAQELAHQGEVPLIVAHARQMLTAPYLLSQGAEPIQQKGGPPPGTHVALENLGHGFQMTQEPQGWQGQQLFQRLEKGPRITGSGWLTKDGRFERLEGTELHDEAARRLKLASGEEIAIGNGHLRVRVSGANAYIEANKNDERTRSLIKTAVDNMPPGVRTVYAETWFPHTYKVIDRDDTTPSYEIIGRKGNKIRARQGIDVERAKEAALHGKYANLNAQKMTIEMVQNAVDAVRSAFNRDKDFQGNITFETGQMVPQQQSPELPAPTDASGKHIGEQLPYVEISDNGPGMSAEQLATVFLDVYSTGKGEESGMAGGYGIAKATFQLGGKYFQAVSTVKDSEGKVHRYVIEGNPRQVQEGLDIVELPSEEQPKGFAQRAWGRLTAKEQEAAQEQPKTGTTVRVFVDASKSGELYYAKQYFTDAAKASDVPGTKFQLKNARGTEDVKGGTTSELAKINVPGAQVRLRSAPDTPESKGYVTVYVTNEGLHQFTHHVYLGGEVSGMPEYLVADIYPTAKPNTESYPFTQDRERIKNDVDDRLKIWVKNNLFEIARKRALEQLSQEWAQIKQHATPSGTRLHVYDEHGMMGDTVQEMFKDPYWHPFMDTVADIGDYLAKNFQTERGNEVEKFGLFFPLDSMEGNIRRNLTFGLNIPNPENVNKTTREEGRSEAIFLNPFGAAMRHEVFSELPKVDSSEKLGINHFSTLVHEFAHNKERGHGTSFEDRMAEIFAQIPRQVRRDFEDRLISALAGGGDESTIHPTFEKYLQRYIETRREGSGRARALSATGEHAGRVRGGDDLPAEPGQPDERLRRDRERTGTGDVDRAPLFQGGGKGAVEFMKDGRALIRGFESGDVSTLAHETAHVFRRTLEPGELDTANKLWGVPDGKWAVKHEEAFARDFERYLYDGKAPNAEAKTLFEKFRGWLRDVYTRLIGSSIAERLSAEKKAFFDMMLGGEPVEAQPKEEKASAAAAAQGAPPDVRGPPPVEVPVETRKTTMAPPPEMSELEKRWASRREEPQAQLPLQQEGPPPAPRALSGDKNTVFTKADYDAARAAFRDKLGRLHLGLDPSMASDLMIIGGYHFERGVRAFSEWAHAMLADAGEHADVIRPHLKDIYNSLRDAGRERAAIAVRRGVRTEDQRILINRAAKAFGEIQQPSRKEVQFISDAPRIILPPGAEYGRTPDSDRERATPNAPPAREQLAGTRPPAGPGSGPGEPRAHSGPPPSRAAKPAEERNKVAAATRKALRGVEDIKMASAPKSGKPIYEEAAWRKRLEDVGLPENLPVPTVKLRPELRDRLGFPGQREATEVALSGLERHGGMVMATSTGTGKTYMAAGIVAQRAMEGANNILVLTKNRTLVENGDNGWLDVLRNHYGLEAEEIPSGVSAPKKPGIYVATHGVARLRKYEDFNWDLVVVDESGEARRWYAKDNRLGKKVRDITGNAKQSLYMSATPFHTPVELGYLSALHLWDDEGFAKWARQLGVHADQDGNLSSPPSPRKMAKIREQLIERGQFVNMDRNMEGYEAHFGMVPMTSDVQQGLKNIERAFQIAENYFRNMEMHGMVRAVLGNKATFTKNYIERARLPEAIELGKRLEKSGYKVSFFTENKREVDEVFNFLKPVDEGTGGELSKLLPKLPSVPDELEKAFGKDNLAQFHGQHSVDRENEKDAFLRGEKQHIYTTYASGGIGVSLHDKQGDAPRAVIHIGLPWSGVMFDQSVGRFWRFGTKSNVHSIFLTSDAAPEVSLVTQKLGPRLASLRAGVSGIRLGDAPVDVDGSIDYELGGAHRPAEGEFLQTGRMGLVDNWDKVKFPEATEAMNKGMKMPNLDELPEPSYLYQRDEAQKESDRIGKQVERETKGGGPPPAPGRGDPLSEAIQRAREVYRAVKPEQREALQHAVSTLAEIDAEDVHGDATPVIRSRWQRTMDDLADVGETVSRGYSMVGINGRRVIQRLGGTVGESIVDDIHEYATQKGNIAGPWELKLFGARDRDKITPDEFKQVWQAIESGTDYKLDPRLKRMADTVQGIKYEVQDRALQAGVEIEIRDQDTGKLRFAQFPSQRKPLYMPHRYTKESLDEVGLGFLKDKIQRMGRQRVIEALMEKNGFNRTEAELTLNSMGRGVPLAGNVERPRELEMPGYRMDMGAFAQYIEEASEAIARTEIFGQRRKLLTGKLSLMEDQKNAITIGQIMDSLLDRRLQSQDPSKFYRLASDWETVTKMTFSAIPHFFQGINAALRSNTMSALRGFKDVVTEPRTAYHAAMQAGAILEQMKQAEARNIGGHGRLAQKVLNRTGFIEAGMFSRAWSVATARNFLDHDVLPALLKDPQNAHYRRVAREHYGLSNAAMDLAIEDKMWQPEDYMRAGKRLSDDTQYTFDPTELPPTWRAKAKGEPSEWTQTAFRLATILKVYAFKQGALMYDSLIREATKGNFRPWIPAMILFPAAGEIIGDIVRLAHGDTKRIRELFEEKTYEPVNLLKRLAADFAYSGGHTLATALIESAGSKFRTVLEAAAGPWYADVAHATESTYRTIDNLLQGKTRQAGHEVKKEIRQTFVPAAPVVTTMENAGILDQSGRGTGRINGEMMPPPPPPPPPIQ